MHSSSRVGGRRTSGWSPRRGRRRGRRGYPHGDDVPVAEADRAVLAHCPLDFDGRAGPRLWPVAAAGPDGGRRDGPGRRWTGGERTDFTRSPAAVRWTTPVQLSWQSDRTGLERSRPLAVPNTHRRPAGVRSVSTPNPVEPPRRRQTTSACRAGRPGSSLLSAGQDSISSHFMGVWRAMLHRGRCSSRARCLICGGSTLYGVWSAPLLHGG